MLLEEPLIGPGIHGNLEISSEDATGFFITTLRLKRGGGGKHEASPRT